MGKFIDLTGQRFGRLLVIKKINKPDGNKSTRAFWLCECDCGNKEFITAGIAIRKGYTVSCGCLHREKAAELGKNKADDLIGQRFGSLIVIERTEKPMGLNRKASYWNCKCDCGNILIFSGENLKRNIYKYCRCKSKNSKKYDRFITQVYSHFIRQAKRRNLDFNLCLDEFEHLIMSDCYYCGAKGKNTYNVGGGVNAKRFFEFKFNGIDRINSSCGYVNENVVSCCPTCNYAKRMLSQLEFLSWISRVYTHIHQPELDMEYSI